MQARGPLMIEHRLIERMLAIIGRCLADTEKTGRIDPLFVDRVIDFISIYADRVHHGKEEDILFRDMKNRNLSDADRQMMEELIAEHAFGRKTNQALARANELYRAGDSSALEGITASLRALAEFYPKHIEKEDKVFFPAARAYFTEEEDQAMLAEFMEFDRNMIHEKYRAVVDELT
jgi:hemerythrin-like domain-containing protein